MLRYLYLLLFFFTAFAFEGCSKKESKISVLNGTYTGTFSYQLLISSMVPTGSGPATINFSGNNYASAGNKNRFPAGGSGTYQISNQLIQFKDINFWTADFDYGLVLNGDYNMEKQGDSITLTKINSAAQYQYRLKRTN